MGTAQESMKALIKMARGVEEASNIDAQLFDLDGMSAEEIKNLGTMARLQRIADADLEQIIGDHVVLVKNVAQADKMVDTCTMDYLISRNLSFAGIGRLAEEIIAQVQKYGVQPTQSLIDARDGNFNYRAEVDPAE